MKNLTLFFYLFSVLFCSCFKSALCIINGDDVPEGKFTYQAALFHNEIFLCGASILTENFVMTAAHCVLKPNGNYAVRNYFVDAGTTHHGIRPKPGHPVRAQADKIYVHRGDLVHSSAVDLAVIKLKTDLNIEKYPSYLSTVNLPKDNNVSYVGRIATVTGFGVNSVNSTYHPETGNVTLNSYTIDLKFRSLLVKILSNEDCLKKRKLEASNLCGSIEQRDGKLTAVCTGDSGGPLVVDNTLIGVVTNGMDGCLENIKPTGYTRVSLYLQFIRNILNGHPDEDAAVFDANISYDEEITPAKWGAKVTPYFDVL